MWDGEEPIGICVFTSAPLALSQRNRFFNRRGGWSRLRIKLIDRQLVMLSRIVLHPSYRGLGLAPWFVRKSCESVGWPWVECLSEMGHFNPFLERAGFVRVGESKPDRSNRDGHSAIYGARMKNGKKPKLTSSSHRKSRYARPVYYIFDNRGDDEQDVLDESG